MTRSRQELFQLERLLRQCLDNARAANLIYRIAIGCVRSNRLRDLWQNCLVAVEIQRRVCREVLMRLGLDAHDTSTGSVDSVDIVADLMGAMHAASTLSDAGNLELIAAEAVMLMEAKIQMNTEVIGHIAAYGSAAHLPQLRDACPVLLSLRPHQQMFHTREWVRELWLESIGFAALLPPPATGSIGIVETLVETRKLASTELMGAAV